MQSLPHPAADIRQTASDRPHAGDAAWMQMGWSPDLLPTIMMTRQVGADGGIPGIACVHPTGEKP